MTPEESLVARAAAYEVLSRFFREGLTADLLGEMRGLPGVGDGLPASVDAEEQAADHYRVLGLDVFPLASAFLEASGRPGGATTDYIGRIMHRAGREPGGSESPDHICSELDLLAGLCREQAAAGPGAAEPAIAAIVGELVHHLLWWLPAFRFALADEENAAYAHMADWVLALAADHYDLLPPDVRGPDHDPLPEPSRILDQDATGVRELAEYLSRPALSGMMLTRSDIQGLARSLGVPRGFGDRSLMLGNLLGAAGTYDAVHDLIDRLRSIGVRWRSYYREVEVGRGPAPLRAAAAAWRRRVEQTLEMLDEMGIRLASED